MRRGAALAMVLLSLGLVAALTVGGAFVARRFAADARVMPRSLELEAACEQALVQAAATLDSAAGMNLAIGASAGLATSSSGGPQGLVTHLWINRLTGGTFLLVAESSTAIKPLLRNRLGLLVTVDSGGPKPLVQRPWSQLP